MAGRVAHDLKNPLTTMETYADMLTPAILSKLEPKDKEKRSGLQNSIFDVNGIIEDVLDFAKTTEIKKQGASTLSILRLSTDHVETNYEITISLPENDVAFLCDARKIEGVVANLPNNAVQALDGQGKIGAEIDSDAENITARIRDWNLRWECG